MAIDRLTIELGLENAKFNSALDNAQNRLQSFSAKTTKYLNNIERAANSINTNTSLMFWTDMVSRAGGAFSMLAKYADGYTEIANRLRLVEDAGIDGAKGLQQLFDISLSTNQAVSSTAQIYQRFAQSSETLKITQTQVASLTETVSKAIAISGASAASADAALMQFGQSLASGVFRGQEFNSVAEQAPGLLYAIADGLGVTIGELRAMANEGQLTTDKLVVALENVKDSVDSQFATRVVTIGMAFENLKTSTIKWIGELDQASGTSRKFASAIEFAAEHLNTLAAGGAAIGIGLLAGRINSAVKAGNEQAAMALAAAEAESVRTAALRAQAAAEMNLLQIKASSARTDAERIAVANQITAAEVRLTTAINAEAAAQRNLAVAQKSTSAGGRLLSGVLGMVGGPLGLLSIGLAAGVGAWADYNQKTEEAHRKALDLANDLPQLTAELEKLNSVKLGGRQAEAEESIAAQQKEVKKLEDSIKDLEETIRNTPKLSVVTDDTGYQIEINNSSRISQLTRDLAKAKADLQAAQEKLNATQEASDKIAAQMATTYQNELDNALSNFRTALYGADVDLTKFNGYVLEAGNAASGVQGPLSGMIDRLLNSGAAARDGADGLMAFASAAKAAAGQNVQFPFRLKNSATPADNKQRDFLNQIKTQNQIDGAKTRGDYVSLNIRRDLDSKGIFAGNELYNEAYAELESKYGKQWDTKQEKAAKKGKKGRKGTDYQKQYTDQISEMQSRLAELNANAEDIRLFGETSQYQEVNKITQDIAANAEKYKNYGTEGVAKLKSLAEQIDSANQKVSIAQFGYNNNQRLDAMQFELDLMGKTAEQQEILNYNHQLDLEAARLKVGMTEENIALLDTEVAKLKERRAEIEKQAAEERGSAIAGVKDGMAQIQSDVEDVAGNISDITVSAFDGMADAISDLMTTGEADFKSFATSIISDINKMIVKMMLLSAIKSVLTGSSIDYKFGLFGAPVVDALPTKWSGGYVKGFDVGGYTGPGGKYTPAGIVHKGEYVLTKEATSRIGLDYLNYLNYSTTRGFASGGAVGQVASAGYVKSVQGGGTGGNISVKVINNGEPAEANVSQKQQNGQTEITVELIRRISRGEANQLIQNNFRAGGAFA